MTTIGRVSTLRKWIDPDVALFDFSAMSVNDPRLTFTGGPNRTYIGDDRRLKVAAANEMRFEKSAEGLRYWRYDPQSTNLVLFSGAPNNHGVSNVVREGIFSIAGYKMTKVMPNATNTNSHYLICTTGIKHAIGTIMCAQIVVAPGEYKFATVQFVSGGALASCSIDLTTGKRLSGADADWAIEALADGAFLVRCFGKAAIDGTFDTMVRVFVNNEASGGAFVGDSVKGMYVGGAQIELRRDPTSFIETQANTVTRVGERASISGSNFSSIWNKSAWGLLADILVSDVVSATAIVVSVASPLGSTEYSYLGAGSGASAAGIAVVKPQTAASQSVPLSRAGMFSNGRGKLGISFDRTDYQAMGNGVAGSTVSLDPLNSVDRLNFGIVANDTNVGSVAKILSLRLYKRTLVNTTDYSRLTAI